MHTNILWKGVEYNSLENCLIKKVASGMEITSKIVGSYEDKIYEVRYLIKVNALWQTSLFEIQSKHNEIQQHILFESDCKGNWLQDGHIATDYAGCLDLDIPLTPFTNSLPIRRLQLIAGQSQKIKVIYCDLLAQQITPVSQLYTCISKTEYHYENVPNDFEANIEVDDAGLVLHYPSLFVRSATQH